LRGAA
jgi:hypothetical protein